MRANLASGESILVDADTVRREGEFVVFRSEPEPGYPHGRVLQQWLATAIRTVDLSDDPQGTEGS